MVVITYINEQGYKCQAAFEKKGIFAWFNGELNWKRRKAYLRNAEYFLEKFKIKLKTCTNIEIKS